MKAVTLIAAASALALASAAQAADVEIEDAVARVVVIPEDRSDVGVAIIQGSSGLPALQVSRRGGEVHIDGDVRSRDIRECSDEAAGSRQPGQGARVEVRGVGDVDMDQAPLIVLRTPRAVELEVEGAVYGSIGPDSTGVDLGNAGCGSWTLANTPGRLSLSAAGSGPIRTGTSGLLDLSVAGSGEMAIGPTGSASISVAGSGDVTIASVNGDVEVSIAGSGDVAITRGSAPDLDVSIAGSGGVDFGGQAGDVDVSIVGSGDVRVASATGRVERNIMGSGDVRIGQ